MVMKVCRAADYGGLSRDIEGKRGIIGRNRTPQVKTGQDQTGSGRAEQSRAEQSRAEQSRAGQGTAGQGLSRAQPG